MPVVRPLTTNTIQEELTSGATVKDQDVSDNGRPHQHATDTTALIKALSQHTLKAAEISRMLEAEVRQLRAENVSLRRELLTEESAQALPGSPSLRAAASSPEKDMISVKSSSTTAGKPHEPHLNGWKVAKEVLKARAIAGALQPTISSASQMDSCRSNAWPEEGKSHSGSKKVLVKEPSRYSLAQIVSTQGAKRKENMKRHLLFDPEKIKNRLRHAIIKPEYDVSRHYHKQGCAQHVARSWWFENITLTVILVNAVWIAVDTQHNRAEVLVDAKIHFQIPEHCFCTYFFVELIIRFAAFKKKIQCFQDFWFICDFILLVSMVTETWIVTAVLLTFKSDDSGGYLGFLKNASLIRVLRVLRITRLARAVKLLRFAPEIVIMLKAVMSSMRCVLWTFVLLLCIVFFFGVAFTQLCRGTALEQYFPTLTMSMHRLLMAGVFPDLHDISLEISSEHFLYWLFWMFFLLLASLAVLNLLVGVLVEIVKSSSNMERDAMDVAYTKQIFLQHLGLEDIENFAGVLLSKNEFAELMVDEEIMKALLKIGIDVFGLIDLIDWIFIAGDRPLAELLEVILQLRSSATVTVRDIVDLRKFLTFEIQKMQIESHDVHRMINQISTEPSNFKKQLLT